MSIRHNFSILTTPLKKALVKECKIRSFMRDDGKYTTLTLIRVEDNNVIYPLGLWKSYVPSSPSGIVPDAHPKFSTNFDFKYDLIEKDERDQVTVGNLALNKLRNDRFAFLNLATGFGKTIIALWLSKQLGLKTGILVHRSILAKLWKEKIKLVTGETALIVKGGTTTLPSETNFFIFPAIATGKSVGKIKYDDIGTLIVDEAHAFWSPTQHIALQMFTPQYSFGLSATPDRPDGLHKGLYTYYGPLKEFIVRKTTKKFTIIKYKTNFIPNITMNVRGELNWTEIINSLAYNEKRQDLICDIIDRFPDDRVLVLTKRKNEAMAIVEKLQARKKHVDWIIDSKNSYDITCKVLVGGYQKIGVGMDDPTLTVLILVSDIGDIRQSEGRIRKEENTIVDIVDNFGVLEGHWRKRCKWYIERGATITYDGVKKKEKKEEKRVSLLGGYDNKNEK